MSVTPKPFNANEGLLRSVFAGRPKVFAAEDLNRQFDAITYFSNLLSRSIGLVRSNLSINGIHNLNGSTISVRVIVAAFSGTPYIHSNGVSIEVPTYNSGYVNFAVSPTQAFAVYLYLIAKRDTVTFADDPVMSGINATEHPTSLASSDTIVYTDARLVFSRTEMDSISLSAGEEMIGLLWSYRQEPVYTDYDTCTMNYVSRYHCTNFAEFVSSIYDPVHDNYRNYEHNDSIVEALIAIKRENDVFRTRTQFLLDSMNGASGEIALANMNSYLQYFSTFSGTGFNMLAGSSYAYRKMGSLLFLNVKMFWGLQALATTVQNAIYLKLPTGWKVSKKIAGKATVIALNASGVTWVTECSVTASANNLYLTISPLTTVAYTNASPRVASLVNYPPYVISNGAPNNTWMGNVVSASSGPNEIHLSMCIDVISSSALGNTEELDPSVVYVD